MRKRTPASQRTPLNAVPPNLMKPSRNTHWLSTLILLFTCTAATAAESPASGPQDVVLRYFKQVLDERNLSVLEDILQPDVIMTRPERTIRGIQEARGFFEGAPQRFTEFHTEIHDVITSGDRVVVRLTHRATGAGTLNSRLGQFDMKGKALSWNAVAIFRVKDGKIAEEWVQRDELGMLLSIGAVQKKQ